ncbi:hypothetical protein OsJ_03052 [Oryza sativa Japonica Group]|uniref:Pre-mRNA-splicing factor Syf1/CRNKL1-like C-terminal HAT-repeats domain-containing protein n=1 Tax=Oryza sativa subsp. japonica TaxID=39947 RepID=B9EYP0_ORYSJ|nr:hypothetical protein OsJ_03052 [Oryza sativa Japonica Group]
MAAAVVAMPVALALPSEADLPYEEDVLRDPHSIRPWRRYLAARAAAPLQERAVIYERAVRALPGSYKLWHAYLLERTAAAARAKPHCGEHPANKAIALMRQATAEPSAEVKLRAAAAAAGDDEPAQLKLHKSAKLWSFYVDLEESLGALASTRAAYEGAMAARAATPQMVINYASFLEERGYFEDSFAAYETGANLFGHPHSKPIWDTYLERFVARHGGSKAERARELFAEATRRAPPHDRARLFLRHARASVYEAYAGRAAELRGVPKVRRVYEQAIESGGLPRRDALALCLRLAALEEALGEAARARAVFVHASGYGDPDADEEFWAKWSGFEVRHGDERTFTDMLRIRRTQKHAKTPGVQVNGELKDEKKKRCADQLGATQSKRQRV